MFFLNVVGFFFFKVETLLLGEMIVILGQDNELGNTEFSLGLEFSCNSPGISWEDKD